MNHTIIPIIHNICGTEKGVAKHRKVCELEQSQHHSSYAWMKGMGALTVSKGPQYTQVGVRIMPNKIIVPHIDNIVAKSEVERAALSRIETVNNVHIGFGIVLRRWEGRYELLHDGCRQGTKSVTTV